MEPHVASYGNIGFAMAVDTLRWHAELAFSAPALTVSEEQSFYYTARPFYVFIRELEQKANLWLNNELIHNKTIKAGIYGSPWVVPTGAALIQGEREDTWEGIQGD